MSRAFLVRSFVRSLDACVGSPAGWRRSRVFTLRDAPPAEWHGCLHRMHNDITPSPVSAASGMASTSELQFTLQRG